MTLSIRLLLPPHTDRAALFQALGVDDDGAFLVELGNPATGATCALVQDPSSEGSGYSVVVPLVRAPWSAGDVLPPLVDAVRRLGGTTDPPDPLEAFHLARRQACADLARLCEAQGAPLPPFQTAAEVDALHRWLLACAVAPPGPPVAATLYGLDPHDGEPTRVAVRLPRVLETLQVRLPGVKHLLADLDDTRPTEVPLCFEMAAIDAACTLSDGFLLVDVAHARTLLQRAHAEGLSRYRLVSPVEIVDLESLLP